MTRFLVMPLLVALLTASCFADEATTPARAQQLQSIELTDTSGKTYSPFVDPKTKAVALVFVSTDCPIANCLLYTSPSPRDATLSRMPSSA